MRKHREEMTNSAAEAEAALRGGKMGSRKDVNIRDVPTHSYSRESKVNASMSKDISSFALNMGRVGKEQVRTFQLNMGIKIFARRPPMMLIIVLLTITTSFLGPSLRLSFLLFVGKYPPAILQYSCLIGNQRPLGNKILSSSVTVFFHPHLITEKKTE